MDISETVLGCSMGSWGVLPYISHNKYVPPLWPKGIWLSENGFWLRSFWVGIGYCLRELLPFPSPLPERPVELSRRLVYGQEIDFVACINRALIQNATWATYSPVLRVIGPLRARDSLSGRWHGKGVHVDSIVVANGLSLIRPSDFTSTGYFSVFFETAKEAFHIAFFLLLGASRG